jgi:dephospho-CoA kinase
MENKIYIGITGKLLSGKGTAAGFFVKNYDAEHLRFSKVIDEILDIMDLPITRINEQDMGVAMKELFGEEVYTHALITRAKKSDKKVVVFEGIRKPQELEGFKRELPNFTFIYLKASTEIRYARMQKRNEKVGESTKTFEEFIESEKHEADKMLASLEEQADIVITNESTTEAFEAELSKVLKSNS